MFNKHLWSDRWLQVCAGILPLPHLAAKPPLPPKNPTTKKSGFFFFFLFFETGSHWLAWTCHVVQSGLELSDLPVSASQPPGLKKCATALGPINLILQPSGCFVKSSASWSLKNNIFSVSSTVRISPYPLSLPLSLPFSLTLFLSPSPFTPPSPPPMQEAKSQPPTLSLRAIHLF